MIPIGVHLRRAAGVAGLLGIVASSLTGCSSGSGSTTGGGGSGGGTTFGGRAACNANTHVSGRPKWTVLVYVNAANNLQPDSLLNVGQMASVGSNANVNLAIQWKQANCADCGTPSFIGTRRYKLSKHSANDVTSIENGDTTVLDGDRQADPATNSGGTSDMGDWRTLHDFIQWGASRYPADNLILVIWDHGSGWQPAFRSAVNRLKPVYRAVSQDSSTNNEIETWELPLAMATPPQPIDVLAIDCSLEQMIEVAYEVRHNARVMVGSEESPPGAGYPYDAWLTDLETVDVNPCDVAKSIVDRFVAAYPSAGDITQSALDLSKMDAAASSMNALANSLLTHLTDQNNAILAARSGAQSYAYPDNKDFVNFCQILGQSSTAGDLNTATTNMVNSIIGTGGAVMYSRHGSISQGGSNGLAVWIPARGNYLASYGSLALAQTTNWPQFLQNGPP